MEVQMPEVGSLVRLRRHGRGKSFREANPQLTHLNKHTRFHYVEGISSGVALLEQNTSSSCKGNDYSSKDGGRGTSTDSANRGLDF